MSGEQTPPGGGLKLKIKFSTSEGFVTVSDFVSKAPDAQTTASNDVNSNSVTGSAYNFEANTINSGDSYAKHSTSDSGDRYPKRSAPNSGDCYPKHSAPNSVDCYPKHSTLNSGDCYPKHSAPFPDLPSSAQHGEMFQKGLHTKTDEHDGEAFSAANRYGEPHLIPPAPDYYQAVMSQDPPSYMSSIQGSANSRGWRESEEAGFGYNRQANVEWRQDGSKYPYSQQDGGKYPYSQQDGGIYPHSQQDGGKYVSSQQDSGKYPYSQQDGGKYVSSQQDGGKYPYSQQDGGKYPYSQQPYAGYGNTWDYSGGVEANYSTSSQYCPPAQPSALSVATRSSGVAVNTVGSGVTTSPPDSGVTTFQLGNGVTMTRISTGITMDQLGGGGVTMDRFARGDTMSQRGRGVNKDQFDSGVVVNQLDSSVTMEQLGRGVTMTRISTGITMDQLGRGDTVSRVDRGVNTGRGVNTTQRDSSVNTSQLGRGVTMSSDQLVPPAPPNPMPPLRVEGTHQGGVFNSRRMMDVGTRSRGPLPRPPQLSASGLPQSSTDTQTDLPHTRDAGSCPRLDEDHQPSLGVSASRPVSETHKGRNQRNIPTGKETHENSVLETHRRMHQQSVLESCSEESDSPGDDKDGWRFTRSDKSSSENVIKNENIKTGVTFERIDDIDDGFEVFEINCGLGLSDEINFSTPSHSPGGDDGIVRVTLLPKENLLSPWMVDETPNPPSSTKSAGKDCSPGQSSDVEKSAKQIPLSEESPIRQLAFHCGEQGSRALMSEVCSSRDQFTSNSENSTPSPGFLLAASPASQPAPSPLSNSPLQLSQVTAVPVPSFWHT